ncbi:MAG: TIM barrel protein [Anaerolineae bacterium]|nr:TIM barrel protein [Anaerolineae bacterium]
MYIGIQTRPWGPERNRNDLDGILAEIAGAGYDGFEIGAQHLDLTQPAGFRGLLERHGLRALGIHVGGEIYDLQSVADALANLERTIAFAAEVGASYLPFSGKLKEHKTEAELQHQVESLNKIGALAREAGLQLCYHNHYWEIQHQEAELRHLVANTDPALVSLCLDVAWVKRGGGDPVAVAAEMFERVGYFHFKDTQDDTWMEVGYGTVDFSGLVGVVRERGYDGWLVVEQDETSRAPVESARMSRAYLRDTFGL